MAITIEWANEDQTVILYQIASPWSWEDGEAAKDQLHQMIDAVGHRVDCIFEVSHVGALPRNTLQVVFERYDFIPKNVGLYVVVGAPSSIKAVVDVLRLMRPSIFSRYHMVKTFDDAYHLIASRHSTVY